MAWWMVLQDAEIHRISERWPGDFIGQKLVKIKGMINLQEGAP